MFEWSGLQATRKLYTDVDVNTKSGTEAGTITAYALDALYDRGQFFVKPGDPVYEGLIVGEHNKEGDIEVNVTRTKKLTNIRAAGKDDATMVKPPRLMSLEAALEKSTGKPLVENPLLRSGLALAGANRRNGGADDGILTALEASGLGNPSNQDAT